MWLFIMQPFMAWVLWIQLHKELINFTLSFRDYLEWLSTVQFVLLQSCVLYQGTVDCIIRNEICIKSHDPYEISDNDRLCIMKTLTTLILTVWLWFLLPSTSSPLGEDSKPAIWTEEKYSKNRPSCSFTLKVVIQWWWMIMRVLCYDACQQFLSPGRSLLSSTTCKISME